MVTVYVILAVAAAAVVAAVARPAQAGPVKEILASGTLMQAQSATTPAIECRCLDSGRVMLTRYGIDAIASDGACSIAVSIKGSDINIEERLTIGHGMLHPAQTAAFDLGYLSPGYYHIHYNSAKAALWTAFTLHVRPGMTMTRPLQH